MTFISSVNNGLDKRQFQLLLVFSVVLNESKNTWKCYFDNFVSGRLTISISDRFII
jgi:hypothetical protein